VANLTAAVKDNSFYTALRGEIEKSFPTTPINYAFARSVGADNWIANALNFVPDGTLALDPLPNQANQVLAVIPVTDGAISQLEFSQALLLSEMTSLTAPQLAYLQVLSNIPGGFNYSGRIATQLQTIFTATGAGTVRNQLNQKATRPGSRAEALFGIGTVIGVDDVALARGAGW
jgi:hypothetical protein